MTYVPLPLTAADKARWAELVRRGNELAAGGDQRGMADGRDAHATKKVRVKAKKTGEFWWEKL